MNSSSSVIGSTTYVRGDVRGNGDLEIHGRVDGNVSVTGDIVLSESAGVKGNISGASLTIAGQVQGDLRGSSAVLVESGARIVGDLLAPRIGVAAGALVRGNVQTEGEVPLTGGPRRPAAVMRSPAYVQRAAPAKVETAYAEDADEPAKEAPKKPEPEHRAPAPVVPALGKTKAKKKKQRE